MRKYFIILLLSMVGMTMYAQKGMQGFGANVAIHYGTETEALSYGVDLKYQYHVSNYGRIEPFASIYKGIEVEFLAGINYHQFFSGVKRTRPYFTIGAAYGKLAYKDYYYYGSYDYGEESESYNIPIARGGFGLDYRISHTLSFQAEAAAALPLGATDDIGVLLQLKLGLTYNF